MDQLQSQLPDGWRVKTFYVLPGMSAMFYEVSDDDDAKEPIVVAKDNADGDEEARVMVCVCGFVHIEDKDGNTLFAPKGEPGCRPCYSYHYEGNFAESLSNGTVVGEPLFVVTDCWDYPFGCDIGGSEADTIEDAIRILVDDVKRINDHYAEWKENEGVIANG
jgi:hypothetical protein